MKEEKMTDDLIERLRHDRERSAVFCCKLMERHDALVVAKDAEIARLKDELSGRTFTVDEGLEWKARTEKAEAENERLKVHLENMLQWADTMSAQINNPAEFWADYNAASEFLELTALTGEKGDD